VQVDTLRHAADALLAADRYEEARRLLLDAVAIAPGDATLRVALGRLDCSHGRAQSGLDHIEQAIELAPHLVEATEIARRICVAAGLYERALHFSNRMLELQPTEEILVTRGLLLPCIQDSRSAINESRARYASGLSESLRSHVPFAPPPALVGGAAFSVASHVAFYLAYHGENDRLLQMQLARLHLQRRPELAMTAHHCTRPRRPGRLRVGFISRYLRKHSIAMTTRGLIDRLSRQHFEVYALRITPSNEDATTRAIRAAADHALDLPAELFAARAQIAALELDVLFFQDIGMENMSYQLAFARLAPVQCVSFGHPDTTGIPTIDYFVSNDLYETERAQGHYSEQLYLLKNLPTLAYYYRPVLPQHSVSRQGLGLRAGETLYLCPQALFKLHPDFDALIGGILARDPNGVIMFIEGVFAAHKLKLMERFGRSLPAEATRRIRFVPRLAYEQFLGLLATADVVLDTVHFNGMNTSLEALAFGTPVVTLPGEFQRGRHTQAMYRTMGIAECIAADAAQYVDIAVDLGTDREKARVVRQKILASNHVLFENARVVEEFERFFLDATARAMSRA
jgi:predicted O-linked N-acetylglucosamine transferase (SPINDLY family)